jgi:hypothetical protein
MSERRIAIVQSNYIPWKGYFDLINGVDEFVLLDDVQYTPRNWRNRNRIKTAAGPRWLTIPVQSKGHRSHRIQDIRIADVRWADSHWSALEQAYRRAPCFEETASILRPAYRVAATLERLSDLNHTLLSCVCALLGIQTPLTWSRRYPGGCGLNERLLAICQAAGATEYLSGPTARAYLDVDMFESAGVSVRWFDYDGYPQYRQLHGPFTHQVSILDLLFCEGSASREFLKTTRADRSLEAV